MNFIQCKFDFGSWSFSKLPVFRTQSKVCDSKKLCKPQKPLPALFQSFFWITDFNWVRKTGTENYDWKLTIFLGDYNLRKWSISIFHSHGHPSDRMVYGLSVGRLKSLIYPDIIGSTGIKINNTYRKLQWECALTRLFMNNLNVTIWFFNFLNYIGKLFIT